jgi:DNA repair protein RadA/Sms
MDEEAVAPRAGAGRGGGNGRSARGRGRAAEVRPLADVDAAPVARLTTGIAELDRVLGGGVVRGSLVLLGGAPGIGKSTLTAMALGNLVAGGRRVLYVTGEESAAQGPCAPSGSGPRRSPCPPSRRPNSTACSRRSSASAPRSA